MLEGDKAESVRDGVVKSLGLLVAFIDDEDKFKPCWELLLKAINDPSQMVVTSALCVFLPALAAWGFETEQLETEIILYFLLQLHTCVKVRERGREGGMEGRQEKEREDGRGILISYSKSPSQLGSQELLNSVSNIL